MQGPCVITADADGAVPAFADSLVWQDSPSKQPLNLNLGARPASALGSHSFFVGTLFEDIPACLDRIWVCKGVL